MLKLFVRAVNAVHIAFAQIAKVLIVGMVLVIAVNVFLRYVFNSGIPWSEEIALLMAVWFIFISFGLGIKQKLHITINILVRGKVHPRLDAVLDVLTDLVEMAIGLVMIIYGVRLTGFGMRSIMPATGWPTGLMYMVLPVAGASMLIEAGMHLFHVDGKDAEVDAYLAGDGTAKSAIGEESHA